MRHLIVVLGDQLDINSAAFDDFDREQDAVWMAEVMDESTHVWSHKARIVLFLSAMRHFRDLLKDRGMQVLYRELDGESSSQGFTDELLDAVRKHAPRTVVMVEPGEHRVKQMFLDAAKREGFPLEIREDRHFFCTHEEFERHADGRKQLRLEYFYRELRKRFDVLMEPAESSEAESKGRSKKRKAPKPLGGKWNYDSENRGSFSKSGPDDLRPPAKFVPDAITQDVIDLVNRQMPDHPGVLDNFDWPVTRQDAKRALDDFIEHRLSEFGAYQDAMWTGEPYLYHSRISAALNLKLLDPRDAVAAAEGAYHAGEAPLHAAEGFIRQILGWREYVRGIYWMHMPDYLEMNALDAQLPLPEFYWTGHTEMHCLQQTIQQTLQFGYAHHIQRLMVTGLFALLLGVNPAEVHKWYLAVYVDAIEWVELPNTLGMSQFGDGGIMATKPYAATGKYIQRMSNYCESCRFNPAVAVGDDACPFTTLYWDFLARNEDRLDSNPRMSLQLKNLERKTTDELDEIRAAADSLRAKWA